ncbi:MAG: nucleotidyltransferase family protein, partial [Acidobacteriota bacterium]
LARARAAVAKGIDWNRLLRLAHVHGLLPLLHAHDASGAVRWPPDARAALDARARDITHRNLQLTAELVGLLQLCTDYSIPVVPLKGPVLAQQIYGSVALRRVGDLDLLLRDEDLAKCMRLLDARGYQLAPGSAAADDEVDRRNSHHVTVVDPQRRIKVELHRCLLRPRARGRWELDTIAPRLEQIRFMGWPVSVLPPEDLLVYLCEHGAEHSWIRLEWLVAVAELLRSGRVRDWTRLWRWADELGTTRRVRAALLLANELFGAGAAGVPLPRDRPAQTANRAVVLRRLTTDPLRTLESPAERFGYLFLTDRTASARLRRCWTTLLTPSLADTQAFPLSKSLSPLYRAARPLRLLARRIRRGL